MEQEAIHSDRADLARMWCRINETISFSNANTDASTTKRQSPPIRT